MYNGRLPNLHSYRSAECDSDHSLVKTKLKQKIKCKRNRTEWKKKFNVMNLKRPKVRETNQMELFCNVGRSGISD